ncbi:MAG: hypothetical protein LUC45_00175 [Paraprevotella sp.]|nr:hypothetical protein [Paraprevotella sp.]
MKKNSLKWDDEKTGNPDAGLPSALFVSGRREKKRGKKKGKKGNGSQKVKRQTTYIRLFAVSPASGTEYPILSPGLVTMCQSDQKTASPSKAA